MPMNPSIGAILVKAETDKAKNITGKEKIFIVERGSIEEIFNLLEKHKDSASPPTFDYSRNYDFSITWQIKETGKADSSTVYLSLDQPLLLTYSVGNPNGGKKDFIAKLTEKESQQLWSSLGVQTAPARDTLKKDAETEQVAALPF